MIRYGDGVVLHVVCGLFPLTEGTAEECCGAAFAA
jgi:hypothetical protein